MSDLAKNSLYEATISGYTSDGDGVARIDGRAVFVRRAISGERCEIRILKCTRNAVWAKTERILSPSEHRLEPDCPVFGKCGGCDFLHMDYEEELRLKKQRVDDALKRIGGTDIKTERIIGADNITRYRNKAIYAVTSAGGAPSAGFYRTRSHDVVQTDGCLIQTEASERAAKAVCQWMAEHHIPAYDEATGHGCVRHVFCRTAASGDAQVSIVTASPQLPKARELTAAIRKACPEAVGIIQNINTSRGNTVFSGEFLTLWGEDTLEDTLCNLRFKLSPRSFYQVNRAQAEKLYNTALEFAGLTGRETALDLYCGTGTITLCLARAAKRVIGAEIIEDAVLDARGNAERNGIRNAEFICADASKAAERLRDEGLAPDVVTVDPPRKGLAPDVIDAIAGMSPERVVYVSCDPATLSRDVKLFGEKGYRASRAVAVDMFPRCAHIETALLLNRS